jgi:hypothetical protein
LTLSRHPRQAAGDGIELVADDAIDNSTLGGTIGGVNVIKISPRARAALARHECRVVPIAEPIHVDAHQLPMMHNLCRALPRQRPHSTELSNDDGLMHQRHLGVGHTKGRKEQRQMCRSHAVRHRPLEISHAGGCKSVQLCGGRARRSSLVTSRSIL